MNCFDCIFCKLALNVISHAFVAAVLIRIAASYRYVQVFV
jgi:hypothetical protein